MFVSRQGYVVNKKNITLDVLKQIKEMLYITPDIPEEFNQDIKPYPIYHETEKTITLPRYFGEKKLGRVPLKNFNSASTKFKFHGELRPHQKEIIDEVLPKIIGRGGGIISLPCGAGKTIIALYLAHELGLKTLVLVHKTFLQDQWIARAKEFTTAKLGIIRQSNVDVENKDIVIGMIQSISMKKYDSSIFSKFGLIIVDECHHIASRVFSRALYKTGANYTIGLSATPKRKDGLTRILHWYLGKPLYSEERKQDNNVVVRQFNFMSSDPLFIEKTQWTPAGVVPSIPKMTTNLSMIERRNQILINTIDVLRKTPKRKILILSGRINHLDYLKSEIDKRIKNDEETGKIEKDECKTFYYIGKSKPEERREAELYGDILFASYEMAQEGLDIDRLNTIIFATPKKDVIQAIGRIMRKILTSSDIKPLIVDIADTLSVFNFHSRVRHRLYVRNKYAIKEYVMDDNSIVSSHDYYKANGEFLQKDLINIKDIFTDTNLNMSDKYKSKQEQTTSTVREAIRDLEW